MPDTANKTKEKPHCKAASGAAPCRPARVELVHERKYDSTGNYGAPLRVPLLFQTVVTLTESAEALPPMRKQFIRLSLVGLLALALGFGAPRAAGQTTALSYQGQLTSQGSPANGNWDLTFTLFDASSTGSQISSTLTNANVAVTNGLFTVLLDFGASAFPGANRWLEIAVRTNGSKGAYTSLAPRQPITTTPYAVFANSSATAGVAASLPPGTAAVLNGAAITNLNGANIQPGSVGTNQLNGWINGQLALAGTGPLTNLVVSRCPQTLWMNSSPYYGGISNLFCQWDGDSITVSSNFIIPGTLFAGGFSQTVISYAAQITNFDLYRFMGVGNVNYAVNGQTFQQISNRQPTILSHIKGGNTNYVVGMLAGANDYPYTVTNAAQYVAGLNSYYSNVHNAGAIMVAFTVLRRNATPDEELIRAQINSMIRASPYWDVLVDLAVAFPNLTPDNSVDGTHPTSATHTRIAGLIEEGLLFGSGATGYAPKTKAETVLLLTGGLSGVVTNLPMAGQSLKFDGTNAYWSN